MTWSERFSPVIYEWFKINDFVNWWRVLEQASYRGVPLRSHAYKVRITHDWLHVTGKANQGLRFGDQSPHNQVCSSVAQVAFVNAWFSACTWTALNIAIKLAVFEGSLVDNSPPVPSRRTRPNKPATDSNRFCVVLVEGRSKSNVFRETNDDIGEVLESRIPSWNAPDVFPPVVRAKILIAVLLRLDKLESNSFRQLKSSLQKQAM